MNQKSFFDGNEPLKITKPIRLIELFAGIGAQAKALENLGVPFEHYRICEFDKYAVKSYNAVHGTLFETSDITQIHADSVCVCDTDHYLYIMTYSFPCTDLSSAGKQAGMSRGSGTRSGLLWEVERLLKEMDELPQILLMENVPEVVSEKNVKDFAEWIAFLDGLGYRSKYEILNSKNYGIPQNRDRCFMVSWLGDYYYDFPKPTQLKIRLKDVLEPVVDEKYYLSDEQVAKLKLSKDFVARERRCIEQSQHVDAVRLADTAETSCWLMNRKEIGRYVEIAQTLMARDYKGFGNQMMTAVVEDKPSTDKIVVAGSLNPSKEVQDRVRVLSPEGICQGLRATEEIANLCKSGVKGYNEMNGRIYDTDGVCPTLRANSGGHNEIKIAVTEPCALRMVRTEEGKRLRKQYEAHEIECGFNEHRKGEIRSDGICNTLSTVQKDNYIVEPLIGALRGRNPDNPSDRTPGMPTQQQLEVGGDISNTLTTVQKDNVVVELMPFRVRKLTPKECWRLMGFDDDSFNRASKEVSNTQLYKQAGNSIVVNVLMAIFDEMVN